MSSTFPDPEMLADDKDELAWDREKHGKMIDFATPDGVVGTQIWDGDDA